MGRVYVVGQEKYHDKSTHDGLTMTTAAGGFSAQRRFRMDQ